MKSAKFTKSSVFNAKSSACSENYETITGHWSLRYGNGLKYLGLTHLDRRIRGDLIETYKIFCL